MKTWNHDIVGSYTRVLLAINYIGIFGVNYTEFWVSFFRLITKWLAIKRLSPHNWGAKLSPNMKKKFHFSFSFSRNERKWENQFVRVEDRICKTININKNSKQWTGENNALLYSKENNTLVVLQILCLLPEVRAVCSSQTAIVWYPVTSHILPSFCKGSRELAIVTVVPKQLQRSKAAKIASIFLRIAKYFGEKLPPSCSISLASLKLFYPVHLRILI